ncbi:MAG: DUF2828 family protein [Lachnospiraceae bacterium]|nr:DUF2828 family protein [Lachnospiraceae bacterium]
MRRAVRFDNQDVQKEIDSIDTTVAHGVRFCKKYKNSSVTENGAAGYRTTQQPLLDLNFKASSLRNRSEKEIVDSFIKAFYANKKYALKWLFFLRDILEGMGERRSFRICLNYLANSHTDIAAAVMKLVPEYGRYDDLLAYIDSPLCEQVCLFIKQQLEKDIAAMDVKQPISLLAKWLPSNNTSSKESRRYASIIARRLGYSDRTYRKILSALRAYSNVVEVKLSASEWSSVDYELVPAKANLKYDRAFVRHDAKRRSQYLKEVILGEGKLNAKGLMPYEIVHRFTTNCAWSTTFRDDLLAELMWQKLTEEGFCNEWGLEDCIVVADGSGSMYTNVTGSTSIQAIEVCNSLAIYFAQQLQGVFHNKAITFSGSPKFIDLEQGESLKEKLEIMFAHNEVANTNVEAVFELLLDMAVSNQVPKAQLPKQVLLISDMEFDQARRPLYYNGPKESWRIFDEKLFDMIAARYKKAGYTMPRLIFWNVCGRTDTIPMVEGESGICLLSGFSQNAMKIAAQKDCINPYESLIRTLDTPRYDRVEQAFWEAVKKQGA